MAVLDWLRGASGKSVPDVAVTPESVPMPLVTAPEPVAVTPVAEPSCGNCQCWVAGECRRYPPVLVRAYNGPGTHVSWPVVPRASWCGEWRA